LLLIFNNDAKVWPKKYIYNRKNIELRNYYNLLMKNVGKIGVNKIWF